MSRACVNDPVCSCNMESATYGGRTKMRVVRMAISIVVLAVSSCGSEDAQPTAAPPLRTLPAAPTRDHRPDDIEVVASTLPDDPKLSQEMTKRILEAGPEQAEAEAAAVYAPTTSHRIEEIDSNAAGPGFAVTEALVVVESDFTFTVYAGRLVNEHVLADAGFAISRAKTGTLEVLSWETRAVPECGQDAPGFVDAATFRPSELAFTCGGRGGFLSAADSQVEMQ
jgi:hypothetical protein